MIEIFSYSLSDFLLFTEATYLAVLSYYHQTIWPLQIIAVGLSGISCWLLTKPCLWRERTVLVLFAASWIWLGLVFQRAYYSQINWLVEVFVGLFCLQGGLLLWLSCWPFKIQAVTSHLSTNSGLRDHSPALFTDTRGMLTTSLAGVSIITITILLFPVLLKFSGRDWDQLEIVFVTPDATAVATFGLLWAIRPYFASWTIVLLALVPLSWCLFSLLTWLAMASVSGG